MSATTPITHVFDVAPNAGSADRCAGLRVAAREFVELLRRGARVHDDPDDPPSVRSPDPGDDYLIALAESAQAMIVSGDGHLLGLVGQVPVISPAEFLAELDERS